MITRRDYRRRHDTRPRRRVHDYCRCAVVDGDHHHHPHHHRSHTTFRTAGHTDAARGGTTHVNITERHACASVTAASACVCAVHSFGEELGGGGVGGGSDASVRRTGGGISVANCRWPVFTVSADGTVWKIICLAAGVRRWRVRAIDSTNTFSIFLFSFLLLSPSLRKNVSFRLPIPWRDSRGRPRHRQVIHIILLIPI